MMATTGRFLLRYKIAVLFGCQQPHKYFTVEMPFDSTR